MTLLFLALGCGPKEDDDSGGAAAEDAVDVRVADDYFGTPGPDDVLYYGADTIVQPGTDIMYCIAGTYDGDDLGFNEMIVAQGQYGHHFQLYGTTLSTVDLADGATWDCTSSSDLPMDDLEPIGIPTSTSDGGIQITYPEGFATKLKHGQRIVMQSHYVNTGVEPIRVRDALLLKTMPVDEVVTWANMYIFNTERIEIDPHAPAHQDFDCAITEDIHVLAMLGHMHEWGTTFSVDLTREGATNRIYDVPAWDATYRDAPPMQTYAPDEFTLRAGDTVHTSCDWYNDTDEPIVFPHEMCVSVGLGYPLLTASICSE